MEYENDKQVIFLKDLFFAILYRWKGILIAAVIGALLLGGFQFFQNNRSGSADSQKITVQQYQLEQRVAIKETAVSNQAKYLQESPLMNMDPYKVYKTSLSFYIHNNYQIQPGMLYQNPDNTPALLNAYLQQLSDASLTKKVSEAVGVNTLYVQELLVSHLSENSIPGVLTVEITFDDQAKLNQIVELTKAHLLDSTDDFVKQLGDHTVRCTVTDHGLTTDSALANLQKQAADQLGTLSTDLEKLQTQLSTLTAEKSSRSVTLMAVIGGLLGFFVIAAIAVCGHIFSGRIYSRRTLINRTGLRVLGCIADGRKKCFIDKQLGKWEGRASDEALSLVCANVHNYLGDGKSLMITCDPKNDNVVAVAVEKALSQMGISCMVCNSLLRDAAAIQALPQAEAILILAQCKKSKYAQMEQIAAQVQDQRKHLLGCILING